MITNTWNIVAMNCKPDVDGMLDYVVTAHWTLSATDGTYTGSVYGTVSFEIEPVLCGDLKRRLQSRAFLRQ